MDLGRVIVDVAGVELTAEDRDFLMHPQIGGVILFARNFISREQISALIADIKALRDPALLIYVDQEGGRVQRFKTGFTCLPAVRNLGALYDETPQEALALAESTAWLMASELLVCGVDVSFAPILDLDSGVSEIIGDRSFHSDPAAVIALATAYCRGMHRAGMASVGKHFPGHGAVVADSHLSLPVDTRPLSSVLSADLRPFAALPTLQIPAVMTAHIVFSAVDALPVSFSPYWLQQCLRQDLQYRGLIFSDDLSMAAAHVMGDMPTRAQRALDAGCDHILVCNDRAAACTVVHSIQASAAPAATESLRAKPTIICWDALQANDEWQATRALLNQQNCSVE